MNVFKLCCVAPHISFVRRGCQRMLNYAEPSNTALTSSDAQILNGVAWIHELLHISITLQLSDVSGAAQKKR